MAEWYRRLRRALRAVLRRPEPSRPTPTDLVQIGLYADGQPLLVHPQLFAPTFPRRYSMHDLYLSAVAERGVDVVWGIDMKGGQELKPWLKPWPITDPLELEARPDDPDA